METSAATRTNVCNVLIVGSGAAGLRAAIAAHQAGVKTVVIGKRQRLDAHTVLAAGGINAALGTRDPEDSWQQHFADTLREGYYLSDPRVVELMAREAPRAVEELAAWGCRFARTPEGKLDQRFFGAHKYRRTCYAGDYTGRAIIQALAGKIDVRASLLSAEASLLGASARRETRGAHHRKDYPNQEPALRVNFVLNLDTDGRLTVSSQPVPPVPVYLEEWARDGGVIELKGRLLE